MKGLEIYTKYAMGHLETKVRHGWVREPGLPQQGGREAFCLFDGEDAIKSPRDY